MLFDTLNKNVLNTHTYLLKIIKYKITSNMNANEYTKSSKNVKIIILQHQNLSNMAIHKFLVFSSVTLN
jgi:hypothetical protein